MKVLPLFKSNYSIGRSILTVDKPKDVRENNGSKSIVKIAKDNNLKTVYIVDDKFSGFIEAYTNLLEIGVQLVFGIRVTFTPDATVQKEECLDKEHKVVIMATDFDSYDMLKEISSASFAKEHFYYVPRVDKKILNQYWNKGLKLFIPFYDSFIFNNTMYFKSIVPDLTDLNPSFLIENNHLPFDRMIRDKVIKYAKGNYPIINSKSIYYEKKSCFEDFLTFKCICNRSTLDEPELDHFNSNEFCFEEWLKIKDKEDLYV